MQRCLKISGLGSVAALGHKPTFYLRYLGRLLCDVNQPLVQPPSDRLRTAKCGTGRTAILRGLMSINQAEIVAFVLPSYLQLY